jgi:hypothetical protein
LRKINAGAAAGRHALPCHCDRERVMRGETEDRSNDNVIGLVLEAENIFIAVIVLIAVALAVAAALS